MFASQRCVPYPQRGELWEYLSRQPAASFGSLKRFSECSSLNGQPTTLFLQTQASNFYPSPSNSSIFGMGLWRRQGWPATNIADPFALPYRWQWAIHFSRSSPSAFCGTIQESRLTGGSLTSRRIWLPEVM